MESNGYQSPLTERSDLRIPSATSRCDSTRRRGICSCSSFLFLRIDGTTENEEKVPVDHGELERKTKDDRQQKRSATNYGRTCFSVEITDRVAGKHCFWLRATFLLWGALVPHPHFVARLVRGDMSLFHRSKLNANIWMLARATVWQRPWRRRTTSRFHPSLLCRLYLVRWLWR